MNAIGFLAAALIFRVGYFAYAFYAGVLLALAAYLMTHLSMDGLQTERHCTLRQGEIGEEAVVTVGVRNTQPFFIPWVVMDDLLSDGLRVLEGTTARAVVMKPGGSASLRYRVKCDKRGYHRVGPVLFESGDFFGLTRRFLSRADAQFITIYPKIVPIDKYSIPTHRPLGEVTQQMWIFEDPTRIAGVREYRHGDPLRRIHWKASAKTGVLHSKIYDPSTLQGVNMILDFNARAWIGEHISRRAEFGVTVAASLASHCAERGLDLGLVSNGVDAADVMETNPISLEAMNREEARKLMEQPKHTDRLRPVEVKVRKGGESVLMVMEALARLKFSEGLDLAEMVQREYQGWPREDTTAFIVPGASPELLREIARLKSMGFSVLVLLVDNPVAAPGLQAALAGIRVPCIHLREEADLHRIVL